MHAFPQCGTEVRQLTGPLHYQEVEGLLLLHQAVEAKEGVEIQKESVTLASISYQARAGDMRGRVGGVCEVGCLCVWL